VKLSFLFSAFTIAVVSCLSPATQENSNAKGDPIISLSDSIIQFGDVNYGEIVRYSVKVKNLSNVELNINEIDYACDCISVDLEENTLSSEDSTWLHINFDTRGFRGKQLKTVSIISNATIKEKHIILTSNIINNN
jgi:hypothetical protein